MTLKTRTVAQSMLLYGATLAVIVLLPIVWFMATGWLHDIAGCVPTERTNTICEGIRIFGVIGYFLAIPLAVISVLVWIFAVLTGFGIHMVRGRLLRKGQNQ